jgi:hypothetical protein
LRRQWCQDIQGLIVIAFVDGGPALLRRHPGRFSVQGRSEDQYTEDKNAVKTEESVLHYDFRSTTTYFKEYADNGQVQSYAGIP